MIQSEIYYMIRLLNKIKYIHVIEIYHTITNRYNLSKDDNWILYHPSTFVHNVSYDNNGVYSRLFYLDAILGQNVGHQAFQ